MIANGVRQILGDFAKELIEYDARMVEAGTPPIRFIHKYLGKPVKALNALIEREKAAARAEEVQMFAAAYKPVRPPSEKSFFMLSQDAIDYNAVAHDISLYAENRIKELARQAKQKGETS